MNMHDREQEERLQAEAEAAERQQLPPGADARVDEYRLVLRALRHPPAFGLPADFAARVARRMLYSEEQGTVEDWTVTVLMLAMAAGGVWYLLPMLSKLAETFQMRLPPLPWPLLLATAAAVLVAWTVDRGASRWHR
jgi:hypothetical protein